MNHKKLLIFGLICAVAGVSTYLYSNKSQATNNITGQPAMTVTDSNSTSPGGIPGGAGGSNTPVQNYSINFQIPDIGMQLNLPSSLADLTYQVNTAGDGSKTVSFSTKSLSNSVLACSAQRPGGAFDTVIRSNGKYQPPANPADGGLLYQAPNYNFAYRLPNGPCAKNLTISQQRLLDSQAQDFYSALQSSRPIER